jgi:GntR family transcriptional regulator, transcriptional repressor for pyruvate dehydrogenase complex
MTTSAKEHADERDAPSRRRRPARRLGLRVVRLAPGESLPDRIADDILELIRSGALEPGSRLPAERAIADELAVSRTVVREALRTLAADGALEVRGGSGRYVTGRTPSRQIGAEVAWLRGHREEVAELNHVLQIVEPPALREVPAHLLPDVVAEAAAICARMETALLDAQVATLASLDVTFHRALCAQTSNRFLRRLVTTLIDSTEPAASAVYGIPTAARQSLDQHRQIVTRLERGRSDDACILLARHRAGAHRFAYQEAARKRVLEGAET